MKFFHGTVQGSGSKSTNSGTMSSGLRVEAHSKQGSVIVQLSESSGIVNARIWLSANPLTKQGTERVLYDGPANGTAEPDVVIRLPSRAKRVLMLPDPEVLSAAYEPRTGTWLTPAGDDMEEDEPDPDLLREDREERRRYHAEYDRNENYAAERRRLSVGKLKLLPDQSD